MNQNQVNKSVYSGDQPVVSEVPKVEAPNVSIPPTVVNTSGVSSSISSGMNQSTTVSNVHFPNTSSNGSMQVQTNSTNLQSPAVSQVIAAPTVPQNTSSVPTSQTVSQQTPPSPSSTKPPKQRNGKTFLLFFLFLLLFIFIFFLPTISEYLKSGGNMHREEPIHDGVLMCTRSKTTDETDTTYEVDYQFKNRKLETSTMSITIESENKSVIEEKIGECQNLMTIADDMDGISITCNNSDHVHTMVESYRYQSIDNNGLTRFTEAGGTYPEYQYGQSIDDIQTDMMKAKYDCEIKTQ